MLVLQQGEVRYVLNINNTPPKHLAIKVKCGNTTAAVAGASPSNSPPHTAKTAAAATTTTAVLCS